jgi:hypothetical protein
MTFGILLIFPGKFEGEGEQLLNTVTARKIDIKIIAVEFRYSVL